MTDEPRTDLEVEAMAEGESLAERLASAEAEAEQRLDDLRRLAAEFDNYRKRVARDQEAFASRATERLMSELVVVLDNLERALGAAEKHEEAQLEDGVRLIHRLFDDILRRHGLSEIEADGEFDPHIHEAVLTRPSEQGENVVLEVLQKGYRLGDRVLRPAQVVVARR
jgi:molecular chaperone GrpE